MAIEVQIDIETRFRLSLLNQGCSQWLCACCPHKMVLVQLISPKI